MRQLPKFKDEEEEANWWYDTREEREKEFSLAIAQGRVSVGKMVSRGVVRTQMITFDEGDISNAKLLAEQRGVLYTTLLRSLLHEAIERELNAAS